MLNMVEGSTAGEGSVGCLLLCSEGVGIGPVPQSGSLLRLSREISLMSKLSKRQTEVVCKRQHHLVRGTFCVAGLCVIASPTPHYSGHHT